MEELSEIQWAELVRQAAEGEKASRELWTRALVYVCDFLKSKGLKEPEVDDLAQNIVLGLFKRIRESAHPVSEFEFRNFARVLGQILLENRRRRAQKDQEILKSLAEASSRVHQGTTDEGLAQVDLLDVVRELVSGLSERETTVARLFIEGNSQKEIAKTLNLSQATVSRYLDRIRDRFKQGLKDELRSSTSLKQVALPGLAPKPQKNPESGALLEVHEVPITQELRELALQDLNEEQIVANLKELREKGGLELHEFLHELE